MTFLKRIIITVAILPVIFTSCNSSYHVSSANKRNTDHRTSNTTVRYNNNTPPKFINNVAISGGQNNISLEVIKDTIDTILEFKEVDQVFQKYAGMLDIDAEDLQNYTLYRFIDEWYGVRYRYGGNDKSGIDCSAFTQRLYYKIYCTELLRTAYSQYKSSQLVWDKDMLHEGDLVFFRTRGRAISHVGIYLTNNYFVHASSSNGIMISSLSNTYWSKRFAGAGKVPRG